MYRALLVCFLAALVFIFMMIPGVQVFSSLGDILMYGLAVLIMVLAIMGAYIEHIVAFTRRGRK